jgi:signal transduction histidine kinase/ligand-binding sensor domain-containing protein/ActR/RegA family two-component response regulator
VAAALWLGSGAPLLAQGPAPVSTLTFSTLLPEDGLPAVEVRRVTQDHIGFIWFATYDGLVRYDSGAFLTFRHDPADPRSLANNTLWDFAEDADGNLWVGSDGGLDLWRRDTEDFDHVGRDGDASQRLGSSYVRRIIVEPTRGLWIGTFGGGLHFMDFATRRFEHFRSKPDDPASLSDDDVLDVFRDSRGTIWIGTQGGGLNELDPVTRRIRVYRHAAGDARTVAADRVSAIGEDQGGGLWVGTTRGLSRLDPQRRAFEHFPFVAADAAGLHGNKVDAILRDRDGRMWFGTDGGGLSRFDPGTRTFAHFRHRRGDATTLASNVVPAVFQDRDGDFWVGHWPEGVSYASQLSAAFRLIRTIPGQADTIPDDNVHAVYEDPAGTLWVGTDNAGLCRHEPGATRWTSYLPTQGTADRPAAKAVLAITRDTRGDIWSGWWGDGVRRLDPRTGHVREYRPDPARADALSHAFVLALAHDSKGRLWVGTYGGGIDRYVPERDAFVHYRHDPSDPESLNHDAVVSFLETRRGDLWAGTQEGLARWDETGDRWRRFECAAGSPALLGKNYVNDILEDTDGGLWLATGGGGLSHVNLNSGRCDAIGTHDGLPSAVIRSLLRDTHGRLWLGTANGLVQFDPATRRVRAFDGGSGVQGPVFNRGARWSRTSGELMMGGTRGLTIFDPAVLPSNTAAPPVVLTGLYVAHRPVQPGQGSVLDKSITLTQRIEVPSGVPVSFFFAALAYRTQGRTKLACLLENFDTTWQDVGVDRRATYTNLPPGTYRFRARTADGEGVWSLDGASIALVIVPAWWQTWWFRGGMALVIGLTVVGISAWVSRRRYRQQLLDARREAALAVERQRVSEQQQKLDELLAQTQKIDSIGRLAGGVAHDLNNMLTPILGHCELLAEEILPDDPRRFSVDEIAKAAGRSRDLIRQLLAFARKQTLEMRPLDLNRVVRDLEGILRRTIRENVTIEYDLREPLPAIRGDALQLHQILLNLCVNAQDAMPDGGRLLVATADRRVDADSHAQMDVPPPGRYSVLTVSDSGQGMDRETQAHLFEPFFTTKEVGHGTGLGLATVYGIVKQHGGFTHVYSEPGLGTTFRVYFAAQEEPAPAEPMPVRHAARWEGNETILLVEDHAQVRELCVRLLGKAGYRVLEAGTGAEALAVAASHDGPIDLLLTDVVLPDINGRVLHGRLSALRPAIRVVYMSGYAANVITHHDVLDEGLSYVQKPFSGDALKQKIRQVLESTPKSEG